MKTRFIWPIVPALVLVTILGVHTARAAAAISAEEQARIAKAEAGPSVIDVSGYPAAFQQKYQLFAHKCTKCHKLSRPINSDYALPGEWSRYIHRMMHKPDSGISRSQGKAIYEFLVYDSSVRKKALLDKKLKALPPEKRKEAEAKIKKVIEDNK